LISELLNLIQHDEFRGKNLNQNVKKTKGCEKTVTKKKCKKKNWAI
jgi:hypothetical protein